MSLPPSFLDPWLSSLSPLSPVVASSLLTSSSPRTVTTGPGLTIFTQTLLPALLRARHEILFVTCFLTNPSPSLAALSEALSTLAAVRSASSTSPPPLPLRVRLGFSSRAPLQRLFHTFSKQGRVYPEDKWTSVLGLPGADTLRTGGIDMAVKSLFFNPLGILHPKFVIIDRATAFIPSCNTSCECWFEGCVELRGDVVGKLVDFWADVWGRHGGGHGHKHGDAWTLQEMDCGFEEDLAEHDVQAIDEGPHDGPTNAPIRSIRLEHDVFLPMATAVLPSTWHICPRFQPIPFLPSFTPPKTPLNTALLTLFNHADSSISIITPNITCSTVLDALVAALDRGVDVRIRTNRSTMVVEQVFTAGTTTGWCLSRLRRRYARLLAQRRGSTKAWWWKVLLPPWRSRRHARTGDVEAGLPEIAKLGALSIQYYTPDPLRTDVVDDEPTATHFKMTLVDGKYLVLGSGNMDRASWYTSQELGILFYSPTGFADWERAWEEPLATRLE